MHKLLTTLFLSFIGGMCSLAHAELPKDNTLIFGLLPSESVVSKMRRYIPLRDYLEKRTGLRIILETASNFAVFRQRSLKGKYDLLETAPHFVPELVDGNSYEVITTIVQPLSAQIVVKTNSHLSSINDLAGKIVATPSDTAIITSVGRDVFVKEGLTGIKSPKFKSFSTHNAAYQAVLLGTAKAAVISVNVYNKAVQKKEGIRSIGASQTFPNMAILVAKNLPSRVRAKIQSELVEMKIRQAGKNVLKRISYPGYRAAQATEFDVLRKYLKRPVANSKIR